MKRKLIISILFLFFIFGCGGETYCPPCDATLAWWKDGNKWKKSYGEAEADDPDYYPDEKAWDIVDECGWSIYGGHDGGLGDTLQITSCNKGVVLIWSYNQYSGILVKECWTGSTSKGVRLGASLEDFLVIYPYFEYDEYLSSDSYEVYYAEGPHMRAKFKDGKLIEINIHYRY